MKTIAVKGASEELHSRLQVSARKNHRSLNQEALARLEMSFAVEDAVRCKTHQAWVDEALVGDFKPVGAVRLRQIAAKARSIVAAATCEETLDAIRGIQVGLNEMKTGTGKPARQAHDDIRAKHNIPRRKK